MGKQVFDRCCRFPTVHVIQNQQPVRILLQPAQHGGHLYRLFGDLLFRQIQRLRSDQRRQIRFQTLRRAGGDKQQRAVIPTVPPGIFDRQPGLAHPAQAVHRPPDNGGGMTGSSLLQLPVQPVQNLIAPFEQRAQGGIRQDNGLAAAAGRQNFQQRRAQQLNCQILDRGEGDFGITSQRAQALPVRLLLDLLIGIGHKTRLAQRAAPALR